MRANSFGYLVKSGIKNLWHNRMMTLASVGTLTACLLIVGFAYLFSINIDSIVAYVGEQNEVVVFAELETTQEQLEQMRLDLEEMDGLGDVTYISKSEAFASVQERLEGNGDLLDGMENDFLPDSFRAKIVSPDQVDTIVAGIKRMDHVYKVEAPTELAKTLVSVRKMVNTFGGAIIIALIVVSIVIITNTIRASVFARRREINIMKYVGATNGFIRVPFVVEGIMLGIIAALISFGLIWGGYAIFTDSIVTNSSTWISTIVSHIVPFGEISTRMLGYFLLAGIATGGLGSCTSMQGYLKV
jgi:cell division transport system permease protein